MVFDIQEFINRMEFESMDELLEVSEDMFEDRFGMKFNENIVVDLLFDSIEDLISFEQEIKLNTKYSRLYKVVALNGRRLSITGCKRLFDYFGSNEPNLLTLSRDLCVNFDIEFVQKYTATHFYGKVVGGELLSRQCLVEVSNVIPELSLAGLSQIAEKVEEFNLLLTRLKLVVAYEI